MQMKSGQMIQDDYPNPKGCGLMAVMVFVVMIMLIIFL